MVLVCPGWARQQSVLLDGRRSFTELSVC